MNTSVERRLARLEAGSGSHPLDGLAERLEAARKRARTETPEEARQRHEKGLAEWSARHAIRPLRGLQLWLLNSYRRACAQDGPQLLDAAPQSGAAR